MNYLNTDLPLRSFRRTLKGKIYVDKSGLIEPLNELVGTEACYICITRPRRFGKGMTAVTYSGICIFHTRNHMRNI